MERLVFLVMMLVLGVLAGVAGPAGASYPSSDPGTSHEHLWDAAPAPQPSATPPCHPNRLADQICEGCTADGNVPMAPCCGPLLAAARGGPYNGMECFCAMLETQAFLAAAAISSTEAIDMYYRCGGTHNVAVCDD